MCGVVGYEGPLTCMDEILRACGVRGTDHQAWQDAWRRLAGPRHLAAADHADYGFIALDGIPAGTKTTMTLRFINQHGRELDWVVIPRTTQASPNSVWSRCASRS